MDQFAERDLLRTRVRLNGLVGESIVDGPGLRLVLFTQGCPHRCRGCHNPETHDFGGGYWEEVVNIMQRFRENPLLSGITFSGGEPFMQPDVLVSIAQQVRALGKNVFVYTGFVFEYLVQIAQTKPAVGALLDLTDVLVDGPYMEELRDLELRFRGSSNQRVLDLTAMRKDKIRLSAVASSS